MYTVQYVNWSFILFVHASDHVFYLNAYRLKSRLQHAYITGFILEFIHPSHVTTADTISSCSMHCMQKPESKLTTKNGSQQTIKTPMTMPRVFAAFFSFANFANFRDSEKFLPIFCR